MVLPPLIDLLYHPLILGMNAKRPDSLGLETENNYAKKKELKQPSPLIPSWFY